MTQPPTHTPPPDAKVQPAPMPHNSWIIGRLLDDRPDEGGPLIDHATTQRLRTIFGRFWPSARPYRGWIALGLLIAMLIPALEAAEIWMFKLVVDDVLVPGNLGPFLTIALVTVGIVLTRGILGAADDYLAAWIGERFVLDLRTEVFRRLQQEPPAALDRRHLGDVLARVTRDVDAIEGIVLAGVATALSAITRVAVFVGILVYLDWLLALIALMAAPLLWALAHRFATLSRRASREARRRTGGLTSVAEQSFANIALVKAHGAEGREAERFRREGSGIMRAEMAATRIRAVFAPVVDLIELATALTLVALGTWAVTDGRLTLGGMLVFLAYLSQLYVPIRELGNLANSVFTAAAGAERVLELLAEAPAITDRDDAIDLGRTSGRIDIEDVHFAYPGSRSPTLAGVTLHVDAGQTIAIGGPNGSGKSTLAQLLVRFYDPREGTIKLDGVDIRSATVASVRRTITLLLQETLILHGSIRDNITLALPGADDAAVWTALERAGARDFVERLPDGLDTTVGQGGRHLSGGQRQLIAIARAFAQDAPIVVLDEPTNGLDATACERLRQPLSVLREGRTTIVVSHDPQMLAIADRVLELVDGRLVEQRPMVGVE